MLLLLLGILPQISCRENTQVSPLGVPEICAQMSPCGADCYTTCDNPCQCDLAANKEVPFPSYGGSCQDTGFCEGEFLHLEDCIEEGGPSCPTMLGTEEAVEKFSTFDFRIDVRTVEEWNEGHANMSIHTPGLANFPAANYLDKIGGLEHKKVLVYCRSGGRAFAASIHLLKYGFSDINSFYHGGFPNLNAAIQEDSEEREDHPTKSFCYVTGPSDICPTPLPTSHISSIDDITRLGRRVTLVDVRSKAPHRLANAKVVFTDKEKKVKRFVKKLTKKRDVLVVFCKGGNSAFAGAKKIKEQWDGVIYWVDNGGFEFLQELFGTEEI